MPSIQIPGGIKRIGGGYAGKCANLLLLYVFWSAVMYYSKRIFSSEATKVLEEPFLWCLLFAPVDPYWYLIVLFCYYVFFAFLGIFGVRFEENGGGENHKRMLLVGAVISGFAPAVLTFFSEKPALFLYRLVYHFVFFAAGVALIRHGNRLKERFHSAGRIGVRNFLWPCFLIALLLIAAVCFDWLPAVPFVRECLAFGVIFLLIAWFCTHETWADQRWLNDLGRNSLYLYLVHNYVTVTLRSLYKRSGLALPGGVYVCVCLVLTILICRIICAAVKKIPVFHLFFHPVKRIKKLVQG